MNNISKVIDRLNASDNLRNFTILSDVSVSLPAYGINIEKDGQTYIVTEYAQDSDGQYDVYSQTDYDETEILDWIGDFDLIMG